MVQRHDKVTELNENFVRQETIKKELAKRRKRGLVRRLTVLGVLVVIVFTVMVTTLASQSVVIAEKKEEKREVQQRLQQIKNKKTQLREKVNKLKDPDYIGEVARKEYNMSKSGETIFKLPKDRGDTR